MKSFFKKHGSNVIFAVVLLIFLFPQTRMPVQVFLQRLISFSPAEIQQEDRQVLDNYHWPLQTITSENVNLITSENRVVFINFWATWCPPCVAEMPSMEALYQLYGDRVDFYFVTSESPETVQKFMDKKGYTFPIYLQSVAAPELLRSNSLPTTYVIAKDGAITFAKTGAANWNSSKVHTTLDALLSAP